jgi:cyclopropane fatty-acyl-phospholipid synthase-like methyltransferase
MNEPTPRFWEIFFEVYENLPRQGPGNRQCATRALGLCRELPESPVILDLGCGVGGQTLQLAELTAGSIVAIDKHAPSIKRLQEAVASGGCLSVSLRSWEIWHIRGSRLEVLISFGRKEHSIALGSEMPFTSVVDCCAPAATLRLPMQFGVKRTRLPQSRTVSSWIIRPWVGCMMILQRFKSVVSNS